MIDTWKYEFRPVILERGEEYASEGRVTRLRKTSSGWKASVAGSRSYEVEIDI